MTNFLKDLIDMSAINGPNAHDRQIQARALIVVLYFERVDAKERAPSSYRMVTSGAIVPVLEQQSRDALGVEHWAHIDHTRFAAQFTHRLLDYALRYALTTPEDDRVLLHQIDGGKRVAHLHLGNISNNPFFKD